MKKTHLFVVIAFGTLSVTAFLRAQAGRLQAVFHTAVTVNGIKVYANFTTNISRGCPVFLLTAAGTARTLFTAPYRLKQAYLKCN
ncbi:MAG: hypothetical protein J0H07_30475 [Sphingobacteriales bacterium]|nr:hypothetical protein [Sphingobacteriales bacterium]